MFSTFRLFIIYSCIFLLTACGGGGGNKNKDIEPEPTNNSINGVINAAANMNFDSDLNDRNTQYVNNSIPSRAQAIQNLVTIHGFVNETPTKFFATYYDDRSFDRFYSSTDESDVFRVQLQAGQRVQLQVVNYYDQLDTGEVFEGDIDLELYNATYQLVDSSDLIQEFEAVIAPSDGLYFINVSAYEGASRYVLQVLPSEEQINDTSENTAPDKMNFVPNQLIIQHKAPNSIQAFNHSMKTLHTGVTRPTLAYLDDSSDVSIRSNSDPFLSELSHLNPDSFQKVKTLRQLKTLKKQDNILDASLNYIRHTQKTPSDTYYNYQWHYTSMNLPQAWDITTGTPTTGSVVVAVIDTGIYSSHPDLRNKLINGYDFISNTGNSGDNESGIDDNPEDTGDGQDIGSSSWHGTHVAGTIAAETNNNLGVAGVSWGAKIMPLRALGKNGGTSYDISQAVRFAAGLENDSGTVPEKRADIINLSIGGSGSSSIEATLYKQIHDMGIMIVAAAGNDNSSAPSYPASYDGVISVSATGYNKSKAPYSNSGSFIDIAAPGGNLSANLNGDDQPDGILSTLVDASTGVRKAIFSFYEGTSMATPHVSGMLALMKAVYPDLNATTVDNLLASGSLTDEAGTAGRDNIYGYGNANALKAVQAALSLENGGNPPPTPPIILASPDSINFANNNPKIINISNEGGGEPSLVNVSSSSDWLDISALTVDANGLGSYRITINDSNLSDGLYLGSISFSFDSAPTLSVRVSLNIGSIDSDGKLATVYILLYDVEKDEVIDSIEGNADSNNSIEFNFRNVPESTYYLITGTDIDNDGYICQLGETCASYPSSSQIEPIDNTNSDVISVEMTATILNSLNSIVETASKHEDLPIGVSRFIKTPHSSNKIIKAVK